MDGRREDLGSSWLLRNLKTDDKEVEEAAPQPEDPQPPNNDDKGSDREAPDHKKDEEEALSSSKRRRGARGRDAPADRPPRKEIEADDRLRVLAYSDSDSDVESHFQRVKDHLLPGLDAEAKAEAAAAEAEAEAEEAARAAAAQRSASGRALTQLAAGLSGAVGGLLRQLTPSVALKAAALAGLRGAHARAGDAAEAAALIAGAAGLVVDRRARRAGAAGAADGGAAAPALSPRVRRVQGHALDLGKAALAIAAVRLAQEARRRVLEARGGGGGGSRRLINRLVSGVDLAALEREMSTPDPTKLPETAAEWAAAFSAEVREMARMLGECGVELRPPRWDPGGAELYRFAAACGLGEADTPAARGAAIESAVRRVLAAAEWEAARPAVSETKLRRWERLVAWRGHDAGGHPILLVRLGRALQLCSKSGRLEAFADAVAAQVAAGVADRLPDGPGAAERVVVVIDFRETSNWEALVKSRAVAALAKRLAVDLAAHYPGRLERCYLLELPLLARMGAQSVLAALPAGTRERVVPASATDDSLPVTMALLQRRRSYARLGRCMSDISLATTEGSADADADDEEAGAGQGAGDGDEDGGAGEEGGSSVYASPRAQLSSEAEAAEAAAAAAVGAVDGPAGSPAPSGVALYVDQAAGGPSAGEAAGQLPGGSGDAAATWAGPLPDESPATADVATNLLGALDDAADSVQPRGPAPAGAPLAPASHHLVAAASTPSTLSPQSSQGAASIQDHLGSPVTPPEGGSAAAAPLPLAGATAMLSGMLPSAAGPPSSAGSAPAPGSASRSPGHLRAHHLRTLSAETSAASVPEASGGPSTGGKKGGLMDLPPRPTSARKTPAKSSLRRPETPAGGATVGRLSSFPLRRQTSVSWAEHLESVREIHATPPGQRSPFQGTGAPPPAGAGAPATPTTPSPPVSPQAAAAIAEPAFPCMIIVLMVMGLLQRLLLSV